MPGFGSGGFGGGPFGAYDWARRVLWLDLPHQPDRIADADEGDHALEKLQESICPLFEELAMFASDFEQLRDPDAVRTRFQDIASVTVTAASQETTRTTRVEVLDTDPSDPLVPLGRCSIFWVLEDSAGTEFTITQVHKLSNAVIVAGNVLPALGAATIRPPSLIRLLGADYGITVDERDPEAYQRSSVRNAWQWLAMKGAERAYDIIAKIAGYRVTVLPLYRLGAVAPSAIPFAHVFEYPTGSGVYYTDLEPRRPLFDEVVADIVPTDVFCWEDDPISGDTYGEVIGSTMQGLPVSFTTNLGGGRWRIVTFGDLTPIASAGIDEPHWYASFPTGSSGQFWLEADPVNLGFGFWSFEIVAGTAPTFGATLNIDYECPLATSCDFCRASALRFEITPTEVLTDPEALWEHALERMITKLRQAVPIHVRIVDFAHIIPPITAAVAVSSGPTQHLYATISATRAVRVYAGVGYFYDIWPADELEVDPSHLAATVTTYTIP